MACAGEFPGCRKAVTARLGRKKGWPNHTRPNAGRSESASLPAGLVSFPNHGAQRVVSEKPGWPEFVMVRIVHSPSVSIGHSPFLSLFSCLPLRLLPTRLSRPCPHPEKDLLLPSSILLQLQSSWSPTHLHLHLDLRAFSLHPLPARRSRSLAA